MGKRLIVAEKPSVGRDIANVLNCRENGDGCRIGETDIVTWAVGHLVGLCYPDEMNKKYSEWKIEDLPIFPNPFQLKVLSSGEKQYEIVKSLMNDPEIDSIVCATDAGREGELIFRYIYQLVDCHKPVKRLWISSLTFRAIKEGFENLKPDSDYDNLYESARCRSEADWLIGMNGSRAYAIENDMRMLSVGRVLSPTLAILVRRELERRNYVPEEYCEVVASFDGFEGKMLNESEADEKRSTWFPVEKKAELDRFVRNHSSTGEVLSAEYEVELQEPLQLYDLTSLQRDANRLFGMSSKWTLDTAQSLYERHKAITYPRTDSRFLSSDIKSTFTKRLEGIGVNELEPFTKLAMESERDLFGRFINNKGVSDHHAIIPTGEAKGIEKWSKQEKLIYELIARRFVAMFFPNREVVNQRVEIDIDGKVFLAKGGKELKAGWSIVDTSRKSRIQQLPDLEKGDQVHVIGMRVRTDQTKPPAPHTDASLLAAMEHAGKIMSEDSADDQETEYGIGTPATRAATIEKMIEKEMAVRKGRALFPTEYGIKLISILPELLQSPEMTGEWEAKLSKISKGEYSPDVFMNEIRNLTEDIINFAVNLGDTDIKNAKGVGLCPVCGNMVREYDTAYYCVNKNCGFRKIYKYVRGEYPTLNSITMRELLANGTAVTDKGQYTLHNNIPYIEFERAPKSKPDYKALFSLMTEYGLEPVDKVSSGGGLWLAGQKNDEMMRDFVNDSKKIGCVFEFFEDSRALKHKSGWCHRVDPSDLKLYEEAVNKAIEAPPADSVREYSGVGAQKSEATSEDPVIKLIQSFGFEYIDKRSSGGSLWIVAGEKEGKALIDECKKLGVSFSFTARGGRASKKRPAWYSLSKN